MREFHELLVQLIALNGGTVVGKTRLQKIVFLLDECGLNTGCKYDYHYYGPFSAQIAEAAEDACDLGLLRYKERPGSHSVPYGVYEAAETVKIPDVLASLPRDTVKSKLDIMSRYSAIELELAATIRYLHKLDYGDPVSRVRLLKSAK